MAQYKNAGFKNDPSVSSEYVNFLIMNTGMDVVDQMGKKQLSLEEKVNALVKEVKVCDAKASTASNCVSTVKSSVEALAKRVSSVEGRK
jgi:hypothetical protein